jgi:hypothetical protein
MLKIGGELPGKAVIIVVREGGAEVADRRVFSKPLAGILKNLAKIVETMDVHFVGNPFWVTFKPRVVHLVTPH